MGARCAGPPGGARSTCSNSRTACTHRGDGASSQTYKPYDPNQAFLLPPNPRDWLPNDHVVFFIDDLVNRLDLSSIAAKHEAELRGQPPHHPAMMVKVLFYAYTQEVHSTRKMEPRPHEDVAFRVLAAGNAPDHSTLARFRKHNLDELTGLFVQVVHVS